MEILNLEPFEEVRKKIIPGYIDPLSRLSDWYIDLIASGEWTPYSDQTRLLFIRETQYRMLDQEEL